MPFSYPGVYVEELPSPVHAITGVATSIAAFVGYTPRGIDNRAESIFSFADFERLFGGLAANSELSYAVQQFYQNGGGQAYVVRVPMHEAKAADVTFDNLKFTALSSGEWANGQLLIDIDLEGIDFATDALAFNLTITDLLDRTSERFANVTVDSSKRNFVTTVVNDVDNGSQLVNVEVLKGPLTRPVVTGLVGEALTIAEVDTATGGTHTAADDYALNLTTTSPGPGWSQPLTITVFAKGSAIPQSMAGLAAQLQQAINATLAVKVPEASVSCSVAPLAAGEEALRISANLPNDAEAILTLEAPTSGTSALAALGFTTPTANVAHYTLGTGHNAIGSQATSVAGSDGNGLPRTAELEGDLGLFTGIYALEKVDLFNLLSIPDAVRAQASAPTTLDTGLDPSQIYSAAMTLCKKRRAFLLIDPPPEVGSVSGAIDYKSSGLDVNGANGAAFFPRLRLADPLDEYNLRTFAPSGVVAGVYATIDGARGVWKAPAGIEATLSGVQSMTYRLTDQENGELNPLGLNCFRTFPVYGQVLWGARTLEGADAMTSQWKYVPVRRTALFIEESLYRGTKWVVFEPNDEPLWAAIRLNVGSFMQTLFQKGAFQGQTADQAYFVKCDGETTTQTDIDNGIVHILVGFAPLKPAEFVVIEIEQLTSQS